MFTVQGWKCIIGGSQQYTQVDNSFENLNYVPSVNSYNIINSNLSIVRIYHNIIHPNVFIDNIIFDLFIILDHTANGDSGILQLNLITGNENVSFNGIETFTKPNIPGTFTVNYTNSNGILTFN